MYFTDKTNFLAHYGVMGMKWGHRKQKEFYKSVKRISGSKKSEDDKVKELVKKIKKIDKDSKIKKTIAGDSTKFNKLDDDLEKIENKIRRSKEFHRKVDAQMKKDGVNPNDRHRGYWEESQLDKNKEYRAASKKLNDYINKSVSTDKKVAEELLGKYKKKRK